MVGVATDPHAETARPAMNSMAATIERPRTEGSRVMAPRWDHDRHDMVTGEAQLGRSTTFEASLTSVTSMVKVPAPAPAMLIETM